MNEQKIKLIEKTVKEKNINYRYYKSFNIFLINTIFLFIISYFLYYLSLEKCNEGFDACADKTTWISIKLTQLISSSIIIAILIEGMFYKKVSKYNLLHMILFYFLFYKSSHGLDFHDHGFFNFWGSIAIIFLLILILIPLNGLIYIIQNKNKIYIALYLIFILIFFVIFRLIFVAHYMNCIDWPKGLNNTYIENNLNIYPCRIRFPKICPFKVGQFFLDITNWKEIDCNKSHNNAKKRLLLFSHNKFFNMNTKRVGFPLLNKDKKIFVPDGRLSNYVKNHLVDMDNRKLVDKIFKNNTPEIVIDFNQNKYGELTINVAFNETLSKERKILEKNVHPYSDNILVIYIDSVSRAYSMRKLKKTLHFIEQFMPFKGGYNEKYPSEIYHSFQFFKYHSFKAYTRYNYMQIFYGNAFGNISSKKIVRITKYCKQNGYITGFINDMCLRETTNTLHNMNYEEICDHEMIICDPNMKSVHSHTKRCLYNKLSTEHAYEYGSQFWRKYKNNRKFLVITTNDGHEGTLEVLNYIDKILFNFMNNLFNENLLINTTVFLLSDHGTGTVSPYYLNTFYQVERNLPMLYIICNDRKNISYEQQYEYIFKNQQILITGYDIYNTFENLIFGESYNSIKNKTEQKDSPKSKYGISLFNKINAKERFPQKYEKMNTNVCI